MKERERKKQGILYVCRWKDDDIAGNVSTTTKPKKNDSYKNNLINKHPASVSCQAFLMSMHGTFWYLSVLRLYTPK